MSILAIAFVLSLPLASCSRGSTSLPRVVYEAKTGDTTNVYTIDTKTGATTQLTFGTSFDGNPGWSPDHKRIVFSSDRDSDPQRDDLYLMDADGSNVRRLTSTADTSEWSARFSPNGKQIAYVQVAPDGSFVALMDADGSNVQRVAGPYQFAEFPEWRRDKPEIYFSAVEQGRSDADIYSVDPATREVKTRISTPSADVCPHFTHDGKTLTYATGSDTYAADTGDESTNVDLYAHDLSSDDTTGAHDTRLTDDPEVDDYGNASPDDKTIVFIARRDGNAELYLMDRDGGHQRRLTTTEDTQENVPAW